MARPARVSACARLPTGPWAAAQAGQDAPLRANGALVLQIKAHCVDGILLCRALWLASRALPYLAAQRPPMLPGTVAPHRVVHAGRCIVCTWRQRMAQRGLPSTLAPCRAEQPSCTTLWKTEKSPNGSFLPRCKIVPPGCWRPHATPARTKDKGREKGSAAPAKRASPSSKDTVFIIQVLRTAAIYSTAFRFFARVT